jgi:hypothetical protein
MAPPIVLGCDYGISLWLLQNKDQGLKDQGSKVQGSKDQGSKVYDFKFKVRCWTFDACHAVAIRRRRVRCSSFELFFCRPSSVIWFY